MEELINEMKEMIELKLVPEMAKLEESDYTNKSAAKRLRLATIAFGKLAKEYRKRSIRKI